MSSPVGRRVGVGYKFLARHEMAQTFAIGREENQLVNGLIGVAGPMFAHPGIVVLTDRRLCLLVHYAFQPDRGFELPRGSVTTVRHAERPRYPVLRLSYRTPDGLADMDLFPAKVRAGYYGVGGIGLYAMTMGKPVDPEQIVEAMQNAWGREAPTLAAG